MHSRRTLHSIAVALFAIVITASAQNTNYAQRITCNMDDPASGLIDLHWLQGAAPILEITPTRGTARIAAQTNVTVELIFSQTPTNALFVKTNAYLASGTSYWMQFGTIGTNSCDDGETIIPSPWWYTVLFSNAGGIYWSGNGRLYVHPTTATGTNGVTWQEWEAGAAKDDVAREWIRQLSNVVENIEVGDIHYGTAYTNVYRGSWGDFASNLAAKAYGWGNHADAGYLTEETDPNWASASNLYATKEESTNIAQAVVGGWTFDGLPRSSAAVVAGGQVSIWCESNRLWNLDLTGANTITAAVPWVIYTNAWAAGDIPMFAVKVAMDADATWAWPAGCVTNVAAPTVNSTNFYMFIHNGSAWCAY